MLQLVWVELIVTIPYMLFSSVTYFIMISLSNIIIYNIKYISN